MATKQALAADHQRALARQPERLTAREKDAVRRLAEDVLSLWKAESTAGPADYRPYNARSRRHPGVQRHGACRDKMPLGRRDRQNANSSIMTKCWIGS
jgi:hypothetical protein